jgi:hypothetical protein
LAAAWSRRAGSSCPNVPARPGVAVPFRACDVVAWKLSAIEGAPECALYWSETRRDDAVAACAAYLKRYGPRFSAEAPPGEQDSPHARAHLRFPTLGRPASADDLREARAISSLDGEGEARVVALPTAFTIRAKWDALRTSPVDLQVYPIGGEPTTRREYLQDGWVWQAEEVKRRDAGSDSMASSATPRSPASRPRRWYSRSLASVRRRSRAAWTPSSGWPTHRPNSNTRLAGRSS